MNVRADGFDIQQRVPGPGPEDRRPTSPQEAAEQFEHILVRQMVRTMTKDLFDGSLAGDDAPQWMGAYHDLQSDILTTELADKITESGRLGIAELLMKQWARPSGDSPHTPDKTEDQP